MGKGRGNGKGHLSTSWIWDCRRKGKYTCRKGGTDYTVQNEGGKWDAFANDTPISSGSRTPQQAAHRCVLHYQMRPRHGRVWFVILIGAAVLGAAIRFGSAT
jgi:hypothetical protein